MLHRHFFELCVFHRRQWNGQRWLREFVQSDKWFGRGLSQR